MYFSQLTAETARPLLIALLYKVYQASEQLRNAVVVCGYRGAEPCHGWCQTLETTSLDCTSPRSGINEEISFQSC